MNNKLCLLLSLLVCFACSDRRDYCLRKVHDPRAIRMARKLSVDIPNLDPERDIVMVQTSSFEIRPIDAIDQMYAHFGNLADKIATRSTKDISETINQTVEGLGERVLVIKAAISAGIEISEAQIDSVLQKRYEKVGDKEKYLTQLKQNEVRMEDVRADIHCFLLHEAIREKIHNEQPPITEDDIIRAYQSPKAASFRGIFFDTEYLNEQEKAQVKKKAESVLEEAKNGADFKVLAQTYNEDEGTQRLDGMYWNVRRGELLRPVEEAAFSLPLDTISDVIETERGYYVIKVEDRVKEPRPLGEVRTELTQTLKDRRQQEAFETFVEELKKKENYRLQKLR